METPTQGASGYYVWEAPGKSFTVHIHLDVIDALLAEIMRGFGAVPKRGAEVGGVLLGSVEKGAGTVVRIEDFEPVQCGYTRGPSYLFSPEEWETFEDACARWRPNGTSDGSLVQSSLVKSYAVGFYRSHTRDGLSLAAEDFELTDRYFPGPSPVVLLVKPFATKAGPAGFFFRENGTFQETTPLEFPFRRRELTGEEAPERRPLTDRKLRSATAVARPAPAPEGLEESLAEQDAEPEPSRLDPYPLDSNRYDASAAGLAYGITTPARSRLGSWMFPLSFVFLLLGVALGYLAALNVQPRAAAAAAADYSLSMAVLKTGQALSLQWNSDAPVIRKAERGVLEIHDGGYAKTVDLDAPALRNGRLTFQNSTNTVSFRLTVNLNSNLSVSENVSWHQ